MTVQDWQKALPCKKIMTAVLVASLMGLWGCGGGGGSSDTSSGGGGGNPVTPAQWSGTELLTLSAGGLLTPKIRVSVYDDTSAMVTYFEDAATAGEYDVKQVVYQMGDLQASATPEPDTVITVDNCGAVAAAVTDSGDFMVAYRGGVEKVCGDAKQADAMFSISNAGTWEEYTGAIGYVERNAYFADGYVNGDMDMVTDSAGNIHICFQFMYEGCDAMNFTYPDLNYVVKSAASPAAEVPEEQVEGSVFYNVGGSQNAVGYHCRLILDNDENPVIFYYAELEDNTTGLRMARKIAGAWEKTWVETDVTVGGISCAKDADGNIAVAYYVTDYTDPYTLEVSPACLRYAQNSTQAFTTWTVAMVDDGTLCGKFPSLAFDAAGYPAIAYYDMETYSHYERKDLKMAAYDGQVWNVETAAETGDIGLYNTLWFDAEDLPYVCTYSQTEDRIYIFHKS